MKTKETYYNDS